MKLLLYRGGFYNGLNQFVGIYSSIFFCFFISTHLNASGNTHTKSTLTQNLLLTQEEQVYLNQKKEITLCIDPNWMPFESFNEKGKHIGLSADIFNLLRAKLNIPIRVIKTKSWDQTLLYAQNKKCDVVSLAMKTPKREEYLSFTKPYLHIPLVIATKNDVPFINSFNSIQNKKIGIPKGYAFIELLKNKYPYLHIVEVKNIQDGLNQVREGELFGYIGTLTSISYFFQKYFLSDLKITGKFDENWSLGTAIRKDEPKLYIIFQKLINSIDSYSKDVVINKWINIKFEKGTDYKLLISVLAVTVFIILIFIYRQYSLKKRNQILEQTVKDKTKELQVSNTLLEKKVQERTKEQNELLSLFNQGSVCVFKWRNDDVWSVQHVSNNVVALLEYTHSEFLEQKILFSDVVHKDDINIVKNEVEAAVLDGTQFFTHKPYRIYTKSNKIKWVLDSTLVIRDTNNNITHFLGYILDITDIKNYEIEINDMKNRFQLAISGSKDGLWDWNVVTNEVYFAPRWKHMLGYEEDEIENNLDEWSSRVHPDDIEKAFADVQAHFDGKTNVYNGEHRMKHKDGSWVWIMDRGKALFNEEGKPQRMVGFHTDITEKKEFETNLENLVEEKTQENIKQSQVLQQQSKLAAMGEMVGAIAHQWRQPLNAVALELQFLEDDFEDKIIDADYLKKFISKNMDSINFMSKTIDDFRNFFTQDKVKSEFRVKTKTEEIMNMMSPQVVNHNIVMNINGDDFKVLGLQGEFQQVILNLLNNSKDALIEKKISNACININIINNETLGLVEVTDNAQGIPEEIIARVFEPYFTTKEQGKGTGLGLYMSKMIIENNFLGKLNVENTSEGAKFTIFFEEIL